MNLKSIKSFLLRPSAKGRALLYRDLADAIERKEGLVEFLTGEISNTAIDNNSGRARVLRIMLSRLVGISSEPGDEGASRSYRKLLLGVVPSADLMQISAIDATAIEAEQAAGFKRLADIVVRKSEMLGEVRNKMAIPFFTIPISYAVIYPTAKIVSVQAEKADSDSWTGLNYFTLVTSNFIVNHGVLVLFILLLVGIFTVWALPNLVGRYRTKVDNIPGFSLYREFVGADVAMSLASLLSNKVDLLEALDILRSGGSKWVRWQISRVTSTLTTGRSDDYTRAFGRGIFSRPMSARIATLTRTAPSFSTALIEIGTTGINDVRARINASADVLSYSVVIFFAALSTVITLGQFNISSDVEKENQPSRVMERRAKQAAKAELAAASAGQPSPSSTPVTSP